MEKRFSTNKKLDVVFLDFDDFRNPLLNAGQAKSTREIGSRLVEKGHKITVISSRYPGYEDRIEKGIKYHHIGLGSKYVRLNNIFYILALPFYIRSLKADIILECFTAPISTLLTPLWTKKPVVAKPTSFEAERFSHLYHLPFHYIERWGLKFYKYFLPANPDHLEKMREYNPQIKSQIVYEGVGQEYFSIKRKTPKHILFLGRLDMGQKGIDYCFWPMLGPRIRLSGP